VELGLQESAMAAEASKVSSHTVGDVVGATVCSGVGSVFAWFSGDGAMVFVGASLGAVVPIGAHVVGASVGAIVSIGAHVVGAAVGPSVGAAVCSGVGSVFT